jgi:UDP-2,4-diacetamido-2,4,6-trideoxy-beta-L-altropyranose hydrolase
VVRLSVSRLKEMRPLALFRADASPMIGGGHIQRCMALAEWLSDAGWRCAFAFREPSLVTVPALARSSHTLLQLDGNDDEEPAELVRRCGAPCALLVVDHYHRALDYELRCREIAKHILVFDDLPMRAHDCDTLLDQTPNRQRREYEHLVSQSCTQLVGSRYAILRPGFAAARPAAVARQKRSMPVARVLVSIGMTDPGNLTGVVLDGIVQAGLLLQVDVVLGSAAPHLASVRSRMTALGPAAGLHVDVSDMAQLMSAADVAIGGAGTSSFERCCLGLPTLVVVAADNQRDIADALVEAGAAEIISETGSLKPEHIAELLTKLCEDGKARKKMSEAAVQLCDGRGAMRVLAALAGSAPTRDGRAVNLRLAELSDSDVLLEWQRQPQSRRFAHNPRVPTEVEHERWFEQAIADPKRTLLIVMEGVQSVGMLRLDRIKPGVRKVSILTAPEHHRRGIARAALELARRLYPADELQAEVLPGNKASHALFRGAGYYKRYDGLYVNAANGSRFGNEHESIYRH